MIGKWKNFKNPLMIIPLILGGLLFAAGMAFIFGLFVMLLWNWLMPDIFGLPLISYWQAWGFVILAHILFKSGSGDKHHDHYSNDNWKRHMRDRFHRKWSGGDSFDHSHKENEDQG